MHDSDAPAPATPDPNVPLPDPNEEDIPQVVVELIWKRDHGKTLTALQLIDLDESVSILAHDISPMARVPVSQTEGSETYFSYTFPATDHARRFLNEVCACINHTQTYSPEGFRIPFWSLGQFLR